MQVHLHDIDGPDPYGKIVDNNKKEGDPDRDLTTFKGHKVAEQDGILDSLGYHKTDTESNKR